MKYCSYVNTKQGSKSVGRYSNGNTLPLVQLPFGMTAFAPQTESDTRWYYHPDSRSLEGIRLTHQPSPWIADYGAFVFMPQNRLLGAEGGRRWSGYRPEEATLTPYCLKTRFLRSRADFELAPCISFDGLGINRGDGKALSMRDVIKHEEIGVRKDSFVTDMIGIHSCRVYRCKVVDAE